MWRNTDALDLKLRVTRSTAARLRYVLIYAFPTATLRVTSGTPVNELANEGVNELETKEATFGEVVSFPFWAFAAHRLVK